MDGSNEAGVFRVMSLGSSSRRANRRASAPSLWSWAITLSACWIWPTDGGATARRYAPGFIFSANRRDTTSKLIPLARSSSRVPIMVERTCAKPTGAVATASHVRFSRWAELGVDARWVCNASNHFATPRHFSPR